MKWVGVDAPRDDVTRGCGRALPTVGEVEGVPMIFVSGAGPTHGDLAREAW